MSKIAAPVSSNGDDLSQDSYQLEDYLSSPSCSFSEPVPLGGADVNKDPYINLDFDDDDSVKDKSFNPDEDSEDDGSDRTR